MHIFFGGQALSDFRKQKLLKEIVKKQPQIKKIEAQYVHLVDATALSKADERKLSELLNYGQPIKKLSGEQLLIVPRPGTISPWSSKATDIAHNAGLSSITRIERGTLFYFKASGPIDKLKIAPLLHDRMTETFMESLNEAEALFAVSKPKPVGIINIISEGEAALEQANFSMGLALSAAEIEYLYEAFKKLGRNPTDAELMMFGVVNSEHARHKVFNARWVIDAQQQPKSLFQMIKNTYAASPDAIKSAYSDNAAVLDGPPIERFTTSASEPTYKYVKDRDNIVIKVETHNHPTAISPFPGAATGVGGEIRDEAATGRGAKSKAGFCGYHVSNLNLPDAKRPWEEDHGKPDRISSALEIMLEAPIGGAGYANEFGRVNMAGYFRTFEQEHNGQVFGYHKPVMLAGGVGSISEKNIRKNKLKVGDKLIVLGGPAMLIGLGGGAASSLQTGHGDEELDFASVQRGNAEMERRTQEVIDRCWSLERDNPILSIHDVGAGGLSNAFPEMVKAAALGAEFDLRLIPSADAGLSPMEIWSNEAQERYVLAIRPQDLKIFAAICERERCPYAVVGEVKAGNQLVINDSHFKNRPVNIPLDLLFGNPPPIVKDIKTQSSKPAPFKFEAIKIEEAAERVLKLPAVGSKKFLITIGDRTVGGLSVRDQMVGPWQVPVSDVAVMASSFNEEAGEAIAIGERPPLAIINPAASARMAVGEAITNILAADIKNLGDIKLSANWMVASGEPGQDQALFEAVKVLGEDFCPQLGIAIPVGKDSTSMRTKWQLAGQDKSVTSPLSVVISAFAPLKETKKTLTPQLARKPGSILVLIDLGEGRNRLGGSVLAQVYNQVGDEAPDIEATKLKKFFTAIQRLNAEDKIMAYHDRSDGGLFTAAVEMMFAGRVGLKLDISRLPGTSLAKLFNEELGALIQVESDHQKTFLEQLHKTLGKYVYEIGRITGDQKLEIITDGKVIYKNNRPELERLWSDTSYHIQRLRDNPKLADQEYEQIDDVNDPGLSVKTTFEFSPLRKSKRPKVAILREQGVNGQVEMAAAFTAAGFEAVDVHLTDLLTGRASLDNFTGLAACGGFSYGDVLGAGEGWAKSILFNQKLRQSFSDFFSRADSFSLGVCNGCQMMAALKELIPGTGHWPKFVKNASEQFEGRLVMVKVNDTPSILFKDMAASYLPIPIAHGEGRAQISKDAAKRIIDSKLAPLQFVDNYGKLSGLYPANPNGSPLGLTGLTSEDGRATIVMPHPERVFLTKQLSWFPTSREKYSPWFKIFQNARDWVG